MKGRQNLLGTIVASRAPGAVLLIRLMVGTVFLEERSLR